MNDFALGLRLLVRMLRAGELTLLATALALAVASMATISLFTDRTRLALESEANRLLGADLVLTSSRPIAPQFLAEARSRGLSALSTLAFRSMVVHGERNLLSEITAVEPGYPLRGTSRISDGRGKPDRVQSAAPSPGTIWGDERLFGQLNLRVGESIDIGERRFVLAALLTQDPSLTLSVLGLGPRVLMVRTDVDATGLLGPGSRAVHRLLVAGERQRLEAYRAWAERRLPPGVRMEGVRDARPEIRGALERAERFMNLAALAAVALAAVAVMLATRRFHDRQLDVCAMLGCLGARRWRVFRLQCVQLLGAGVVAAVAGCLLGYLCQALLGHWLAGLVGIELPQPGYGAALRASALGLVLLLAFGLPPLLGLRKVPALRVLRRDAGPPGIAGAGGYVIGIACVAGLVLWHAGDPRLGAYVLLGCAGTMLAAATLTWSCLHLLRFFSSGHAGSSWRYGIASLRRRSLATVWQVLALSLGLTALLTLTLIRSDLLNAWQANLPPDAPNRFLINIQPDQVRDVQALLLSRLGERLAFYPMVRGRLVAVNGKPIEPNHYEDRARRLVEREFNLSWSATLPSHNRITAGAWAAPADAAGGLSVEDGIGRTLGLKLDDRLTYDVAGERFEAPITSLRKVEWDSFRVNFFVIGSPSLLQGYPATYITSFHLSPERSEIANELVQHFPNVLVIDVAALVAQVQAMIEQVSRAVTFVFLFTLAAGVLVLYAGILATHEERVREVAIMRTLGATRRHVLSAHATEFASIGAMAGLFAAAGASALGYLLARNLLDLPYRLDPLVWLLGLAGGALGVGVAGLFFTRRVLVTSPLASLRQLA